MNINLANIDFAPGQGGGGQGGQVGDGTWMNPYTVSEAISAGPSNDVYVKGEVVSVSQNYTSSYGLATYVIKDDSESTMTVYRSYYFNNKRAYEFPSFCVRDLVAGDEVIVYGDTGWYGGVFQFTPATSSCLFMLNGWRPEPDASEQLYITSNGDFDVAYYGYVAVDVQGGGGSDADQYIYRNGDVDDSGLQAIGWTQNDINYYRYNSPHYAWRNSEYTVSQADKDLYGVIDASNKDSYKSVVQYLPVYDMSGVANYDSYFSGFSELRAIPFIDLSTYTDSCNYMFRRCYKLETIPPLDFSGCSSTQNLFEDCYSLVSVPSPLMCSRVTSLNNMFANCRSLVELPQLITDTLQSGDNFCQGCSSLKIVSQLDLSYMYQTKSMFDGCLNLEKVSFTTNSYEIEPGTFITLYALPLDIELAAMFRNCKLLDFNNIPGFYVSTSATRFNFMFEGCESMIVSPVMNYIGGDVRQMFMGCKNLNTFDNVYALGNFTDCSQMFAACDELLHINKSLPTSNCTASKMREMFRRCYYLENITGIDFSSCDTDPVLFGPEEEYMKGLTSITVNGSINVSFPYTFSRCIALNRSSVLSILTAMSNANNADPKDMVFSVEVTDGQDLQDLLTACTAKGWNITGLTVVPVV